MKSTSTPSSRSVINRMNRENILLWRCPLKTLKYSFLEVLHEFCECAGELCQYKKSLTIVLLSIICIIVLYFLPGWHSPMIDYAFSIFITCVYWVTLGVLSSIGFVTGLPTFFLYLAPFIASVTLAAYECDSLDFPQPPYPDQIFCPANSINASYINFLMAFIKWTGKLFTIRNRSQGLEDADESVISIWAIMSKVRLECLMWGFGTALGELPLYFMAKAARLSKEDPDNEDRSFVARRKNELENLTFLDRLQIWVEQFVLCMGFWGILLFASVPNPLFDLVGIACGHYLVPILTFVSATLIGKCIIKTHIQAIFVIVMFSEKHADKYMAYLHSIPLIGQSLQGYVKELLNGQKEKLHGKNIDESQEGLLKSVFELMIAMIIVYFLVSTINTLAQYYHLRLSLKETEDKKSL